MTGTIAGVHRTLRHEPAGNDPGDLALQAEMRALVRRHEGVVHQFRLERLGAQAAGGPGLAVRHSSNGWCGDRMTLVLDDGRLMRLHLLWPRCQSVAAILGVRWTERLGWLVTVRTTAGESVSVYAWRGRVFLPRGTAHDPAGWALLG